LVLLGWAGNAVSVRADSQPEALELLLLVKQKEAEQAAKIDAIQFRVTETREELDGEGKVEDSDKESRFTVGGGESNPASRELKKAEVEGSEKENFSILASSNLFDWKSLPEEKLEGTLCRVLSFQPKEGVEPENQREKVMGQLAGTYWVGAEDFTCRKIVGKLTRLVPVLGFFAELRELEFLWRAQNLPGKMAAPLHVEYRYKATVFPFFTTHERHVLQYEVLR
jgi:hypothetical protein